MYIRVTVQPAYALWGSQYHHNERFLLAFVELELPATLSADGKRWLVKRADLETGLRERAPAQTFTAMQTSWQRAGVQPREYISLPKNCATTLRP